MMDRVKKTTKRFTIHNDIDVSNEVVVVELLTCQDAGILATQS